MNKKNSGMELLQYKYHDAYIVQASSTDIGLSWRKFKARAKKLYICKKRQFRSNAGNGVLPFSLYKLEA